MTSSEYPDMPVDKDSCSGVWIFWAKKINELTQTKAGKVTISGPDRFGLGDHTVMNLIQGLPNAEKCSKYRR